MKRTTVEGYLSEWMIGLFLELTQRYGCYMHETYLCHRLYIQFLLCDETKFFKLNFSGSKSRNANKVKVAFTISETNAISFETLVSS